MDNLVALSLRILFAFQDPILGKSALYPSCEIVFLLSTTNLFKPFARTDFSLDREPSSLEDLFLVRRDPTPPTDQISLFEESVGFDEIGSLGERK